jgi:hypothetical protein
VLAGLARHGPVEVVLQRGAEIGVGAVVDDLLRAPSRWQAAQVGHTLFSDDDVHVVLGVIHVADHRHQAGNGPVARRRGREEHRDVGVAREVAGTADAVLNARTHHVRRVHVAVDVGLDHAVHRQAAQAANHLGMVADLLGSQHDSVAVVPYVVAKVLGRCIAERKGSRRNRAQRARAQHLEHAVLDDLGVGAERTEGPFVQPGQHRVGDVADARLQWQQGGRYPSLFYFVRKKVQDVARNQRRRVVGGLEVRVAIRGVGLDDGDDLLARAV